MRKLMSFVDSTRIDEIVTKNSRRSNPVHLTKEIDSISEIMQISCVSETQIYEQYTDVTVALKVPSGLREIQHYMLLNVFGFSSSVLFL
jgi:hypothetical protein